MRSIAAAAIAIIALAILGITVPGGSARANGVPQLVKLTYLDGVSNWGPKNAEGVLEFSFAEAYARDTGALLVHPFEDPEVIAGQGTIALELREQLGRFDVVVVAIGGGGLIGGIALALKALAPEVRVIGVEPTGATAMKDSMAAGRLVALDKVETIAGTLAPRNVGPHTLALASRFVDEIVLVSDAELKGAMKMLWNDARVLVEPAGAAAVAAVAGGQVDTRGKRVAVLVCGANLDTALAAEALG